MKTMPRLSFIVTANIVWLAQFAAIVLVVVMPDYVAWWKRHAPELQLGCFEDSFRYEPLDRLFTFGLLWLISAPLMSVIAWRVPERWPSRLSHLWWNSATPSRSTVTAAAVLAVMLWPVSGIINAPVTSTLLLEAARAIPLLGAALYYRAIALSAAEPDAEPRRL
jgi:hypothetical protein